MSKHVVSGRDETVRLFKNPVLEYFSHINPATPIAFTMRIRVTPRAWLCRR